MIEFIHSIIEYIILSPKQLNRLTNAQHIQFPGENDRHVSHSKATLRIVQGTHCSSVYLPSFAGKSNKRVVVQCQISTGSG